MKNAVTATRRRKLPRSRARSPTHNEDLQDRIVAYLGKAENPTRRQLNVIAGIFGMSISEIMPVVESLERAGRLRVDRPIGSTVLSIPSALNRPKR